MKYYLIAGEASGDTYGSLLMKKLREQDSEAIFRYWGGSKMKSVCNEGQIKSISETSFMGFLEVAKNFSIIRNLFKVAKSSIIDFNPDIIIFIDYPGFNLRIMEWAHRKGFKTTFYVSPQLWAWKKNRYKKLRDYADLFFVILPFEKSFFDNLNTPNTYYGHPLTEIIPAQKQSDKSVDSNKEIKTIGLFPGSRLQEIEKHLPTMISFTNKHSEINFIIAGVSHLKSPHYQFTGPNVSIVYDKPYEVIKEVDIAISSSGTATLEIALHNTPQIVVYKTSSISYSIGKRIIDLKYISLVNLIANKQVVPEMIQGDYTVEALEESYNKLCSVDVKRNMIFEYQSIRKQLGEGEVSRQIARDIVSFIEN